MTKKRQTRRDDLADWKRIDAMSDHEIRKAIRMDPDLTRELIEMDFRRMQVSFPPRAIRRLREHLGLTRAIFAGIIGVHESTLGKWERGVSRLAQPTHNLLRLLERDPNATRLMVRAA